MIHTALMVLTAAVSTAIALPISPSVPLPDQVFLKTRTESFNHDYFVAF